MSALNRLQELGMSLPPVTTPGGSYVPYTRSGNLVFTSGQLPLVDGSVQVTGKLGAEVSVEEGIHQAEICALNILAIGNEVAPELVGLKVLKVVVYVASDPSFDAHPKVANGASELFQKVLGDAGRHARAAVGMAALPRNAPVEVEAVLEVS